ncbi:uncharacterized protein LOC125055251 [Pieris napi]|uniref:uncharacterized protein LOC125055251 n=1 Tax=Pieris napi TaxID=78633 RepID=UPI001FB9FB6A|nr:uncharacterized protein LOC125055251 [Pieris napi]XP_047513586.1 uncharacterized protein LOC125055251 [Pieris napi]
MECEENGGKCWSPACRVKRKRRTDDARDLHMPDTHPMPGTSSSQSMHNKDFQPRKFIQTDIIFNLPTRDPFMNNMDEISYWVYTKRAPCLYDYDKLMKKQTSEAHSSRDYALPVENEVSPPKKKKKNLLDNNSYLSEKQQNVYFETPQQNLKRVVNNCKSISSGSGIEVNIKNTSTPKPKKPRINKINKNSLTRRNKTARPTPKVESPSQQQNLRRSLRLQQSMNTTGIFDSSVEIVNESAINGIRSQEMIQAKQGEDSMKILDSDLSRSKKEIIKRKSKNEVCNGEYEDYSDVSGFTANYIRSTKLKKTPRKVRRRTNKITIQGSGQNVDDGNKVIVCVNKSMNTGEEASAVLNNSTDSSQNVINLITVSNKEKSKRINQSTSLLKFVNSTDEKHISKNNNGHLANESFQSGSSATSRYPRRVKNTQNKRKPPQKKNDRKENSPERFVYRTRSRKRLIENTCEQINSNEESSSPVINVGSPVCVKKNIRNTDAPQQKCITSIKKQSLKKDSLRDKSGFATCFSDSDSDVEPKQRKFFC